MEHTLISLEAAAKRLGLSEAEVLRQCKEISFPVYCSPPAFARIWEFKSITDDPAYSVWGRAAGPRLWTRDDLTIPRTRYQEKALPPRTLDSVCFFKLGHKEIEEVLQKGCLKTKGFTEFYLLTDGVMGLGTLAVPREEELALIRTRHSRLVRYPALRQGHYSNEFYGIAASGERPKAQDDLGFVALGYPDIYLERKRFLENQERFTAPRADVILQVFPQLKGCIDEDNGTNQIPEKLAAVLVVGIQAWYRTPGGEPLRKAYEWIGERLLQEDSVDFGKETMEKICTICAYDYEYAEGDIIHEAVTNPSRKPKPLVKSSSARTETQIKKSGLLVLVDAWVRFFKNADLWNDKEKKPDNRKMKQVEDEANHFLEAYLSAKLARHLLLILKETKPWQDI